jgi:hypothetical protein
VTVQPFGSASIVHPGRTATYTVWVWSAKADSKQVTVGAAVRHVKGAGKAHFSVCPSAQGSTCALGDLPQGRADELQVKVPVNKSATTGNNLTLNASAQGKHATSASASAAVKITAVPAAPAPDPGTSDPGFGSDPGTGSLPVLPTVPAAPVTGSSTDPGGLFPTVSPRATANAGKAAAGHHTRKIRATSAGYTLPLDPRLIGGQVAGLVVLAAAIAIALARLSFRPQRPGANDEPTDHS